MSGIGRMLERALAQAGLSELADARAARRGPLGRGPRDLGARRICCSSRASPTRCGARSAATTCACCRRRGQAAPRTLVRLQLDAGRSDGPTGEELLREIALARLATPCTQGIALSFEQLGLELAQTALAFGADALWGELDGKRTLPLLDSSGARRQEIEGVDRRARAAAWSGPTRPRPPRSELESRS